MPSESQATIQKEWGEEIPLKYSYGHPTLRENLIKGLLLNNAIRFSLCPNLVEIGSRLNPYSLETAWAFHAVIDSAFLSDVAYRQEMPAFTYPGARITISNRGVPKDDRRILKLAENKPTAFFYASILNYIPNISVRKFMQVAEQVFVVNNHMAGAGLAYNGNARSYPEEILEDLDKAGLSPVYKNQGEYWIAGVFQRNH